MSTPKLPFSPNAIAALDLAERNALPPSAVTVLLRQAEILRPIAEATLADARHVAFRDRPALPRFMA